MSSTQAPHHPVTATDVVARVLVGVENTPQNRHASRQARALAGAKGSVTAVAVADLAAAAQAGAAAPHAAARIRADAQRALDDAVALCSPDAASVMIGRPRETLLGQVAATGATLLALGAAPHRRTTGLLMGAVGASLLRHSPCSVLVARDRGSEGWPRRIVAGIDGSPQSLDAAAVAADLALSHGAELVLMTSLGGKAVDLERIRETHAQVAVDARAPVDALLAAACDADLLVIGSRGRHGLGVFGSVSERVAHRASTSVLVLRTAS